MFKQKEFFLTNKEYDTIKKWAESHECSCRNNKSCCGGKISVTFTPTTIGTSTFARCICGAEIDLDTLV